MAEIRVPALGESVTEATIGKWFKKPGDAVAVDEPLVELETDKVTIEVPAPAAGVLSDIAVKDGDTVAVGALLGEIKEGAGAAPAKATRPPRSRPRRCRSFARAYATASAPKPRRQGAAARRAAGAVGAQALRRIRHGRRDGAGTGKDGRVTKGDMLAAIERAAAQPMPVAQPAAAVRCARPRRPTMPRARSACA